MDNIEPLLPIILLGSAMLHLLGCWMMMYGPITIGFQVGGWLIGVISGLTFLLSLAVHFLP